MNAYLNDCEWCYTSQIVIQMIVNYQTGKPQSRNQNPTYSTRVMQASHQGDQFRSFTHGQKI